MSCVKLCGSGVLASRGPALAGVPVFGVVPVAGFGRLSPNRKLGLVSCRVVEETCWHGSSLPRRAP
jgi:hypothetical protein